MISKPEKFRAFLIIAALSLLLNCPASSSSGPAIKPSPVINSIPVDGETNFPAGGNIILTYSGSIIKGRRATITISSDTGTNISFGVNSPVVSVLAGSTADTNTVTINPSRDLLPGDYTLTIPRGAFMVFDPNRSGADIAAFSLMFSVATTQTENTISSK